MAAIEDALGLPEILVVDDSTANRYAIGQALDGIEHVMLEASTGEDALRVLLERDVALVLLDVRMPGMDGLETARMIRARPRSRNVPIIFITGYEDEEVGSEAYRLGAVDFMSKPLRANALRAKVSVFVELHRSARMIARQAERLREVDRQRHEQELVDQRRLIEEAALRRQMAEHKRTSARLTEADRRKDEFLAILGHELRNPLVPLVFGLRRFAEAELSPELHRVGASMERQVHHLARLVDDLLDVTRITSGSIELSRSPVAIDEVLEQAIAIASPELELRGLELVVDPPPETWVDGDSVRMTQALANILNNAVRYTKPPGCVRLSGRRRDGAIEIEVVDTGQGMDEAMLRRAFEMFAQARPGSGGLGIGLALARQLIELHGGEVTATSDGPGTGSAVSIRLPVIARPAGGRATRPAPQVEPRCLRVVVIEDDDDLRAAVGDLLRGWGHQVELVATGQEGLDAILEAPPDVAVVDIGLPDIDGYQVAQVVRAAELPAQPRLIAMTGFGQARDRERARDAGFDVHITKPPSIEGLRAAIIGKSL
jgi:signal transduction histidine kinase